MWRLILFMMSKLRLAANKPILKIISIIIILSFLLTGTAGYIVIGSRDYIAKVNGVIITKDQFQQAVQQEKDLFKEEGLHEELIKIMSSKESKKIFYRQILERLIGIILLNQYSEKIGLSVSDEKVKKEIYQMSFFQKNGNFNQKKYQFFLKQNKIKNSDFLENVRKNLIYQQIIDIYFSDEFILPEEFKFYIRFLLEQRKIKLSTLFFSDYYSKQTVNNKELLNYYTINQKNFFSPDRININYIKFNLNSQNQKISFSENELRQYYIQNKEEFIEKEKRHYSMIQLDTKEKSNFVLKSLRSGVNFKKMVLENSTDKLSLVNNGSIGWFDIDSIPYEIKDSNLNVVGQISDVIKSGKSYVIFRLDEIKNKKIKKFNLVKGEIFKKLKYKKLFDEFNYLKKNLNLIISKHEKSFSKIENIVKRKKIKTGFFDKKHFPKEINYTQIVNSIFDKNFVKNEEKKDCFLKLIDLDNENFVIFQIKDYIPQTLQTFNEAKKKIIHLVKLNKTSFALEEKAKEVLFYLKNKKNKLKVNINFSKPLIINRFWENKLLADSVFNMPSPQKNNPIYFVVKDKKNNLIIIEFLETIHKLINVNKLNPFFKHYKIVFSNIIFEIFMNVLHNDSKIEIGKIDELF